MKVYIVNYRGTIYAVYDSYEKARAFADTAFGKDSDANIVMREVE